MRFLSTRRRKDLIRVLSEALKARPEHLDYDPKEEESRLAVAEAYRVRLDDGTRTEWAFSIVAD